MNEDKNQNRKEDCPLCHVSKDTIKNLEKAGTSEKEKYFLRKEKKEQEFLLKNRKKKIKKIIKFSLLSLIIILIAGGAVFAVFGYVKDKNFGRPEIEIAHLEYDAGVISMVDGLIKHTYEIKNIGKGDLKIEEIRTSCMCTTARLRIGSQLSREFGMHDNSFGWSETIAPGETGYLDVIFDPAFHGPSGIGQITRAIYILTNDPANKNIEFLLTANITE